MRTQIHTKPGLLLLSGVVFVLTASLPVTAAAQDVGQLILEEIIVTAQKRQETLQDVPISVNVLGSEVLEDAGLDKIEDIQHYVPNLQMTESGISTQMYVRGIGTGNNQGFEQSVGMASRNEHEALDQAVKSRDVQDDDVLRLLLVREIC